MTKNTYKLYNYGDLDVSKLRSSCSSTYLPFLFSMMCYQHATQFCPSVDTRQSTWKPKEDFYETSMTFSYIMYLCYSYGNYILSTAVNVTGTKSVPSFQYAFGNQ